jgi:glucose-6-phosphate 1-dehydrogenase
MAGQAADVLVIFGITGDLARKMTFRALYRLERTLPNLTRRRVKRWMRAGACMAVWW